MTPSTKALRKSLRIVWAIAFKDIVDALKNRNTLTNIIVVFLVMVAYKWLPNLVKGDDTFLVVYDPGNSRLVDQLDDSPRFNPLRTASMQALEGYMDDLDVRNLGLVIPADYNQTVDSGRQPVLDGYVLWSSRSGADELRLDYEQQLTELIGQPIGINIKAAFYPPPDSMGSIHMTSVTFVITILFMGTLVVPHLMFEEKRTKTLDALLVSPASVGQAVVGKALAGLFYTLMGAVAVFAFYSDFVVNWGLAILAFVCGTLFAVGLGLLLGILLETRQQMILWTWIIFPPLLIPVFLSGLDPILPKVLRTLIPGVPTVALAILFRFSFSSGANLARILTHLAVVLGSSVVILALVVWRVRQSDR
jgi:ABC-type Na+ efflux pump permease subunit